MDAFDDDDEWEAELLRDPRFIAELDQSRKQIARGEYVRLEDLPD